LIPALHKKAIDVGISVATWALGKVVDKVSGRLLNGGKNC
jgi:hypothetical protein